MGECNEHWRALTAAVVAAVRVDGAARRGRLAGPKEFGGRLGGRDLAEEDVDGVSKDIFRLRQGPLRRLPGEAPGHELGDVSLVDGRHGLAGGRLPRPARHSRKIYAVGWVYRLFFAKNSSLKASSASRPPASC